MLPAYALQVWPYMQLRKCFMGEVLQSTPSFHVLALILLRLSCSCSLHLVGLVSSLLRSRATRQLKQARRWLRDSKAAINPSAQNSLVHKGAFRTCKRKGMWSPTVLPNKKGSMPTCSKAIASLKHYKMPPFQNGKKCSGYVQSHPRCVRYRIATVSWFCSGSR